MPEMTTNLTPAMRRKNQIKLLILWMIPVVLMAIAGLCYYLIQTGHMTIGSKNNGVLLQPPIQLKELLVDNTALVSVDENGKTQSVWDNKWTLVIRGDNQCDERCRDSLYWTGQIHIRLDKKANRVQRIYLYDNGGDTQSELTDEFKEFIASKHRLLKPFAVSPEHIASLDSLLVTDSGERARFFVVDPAGWAMMYYLDQHEGNQILKDLKHLLKFSSER